MIPSSHNLRSTLCSAVYSIALRRITKSSRSNFILNLDRNSNFPERKWSGNMIGTYLCGSRTSIDKRGSKSLGAEGATWHYTWLPDAWLLPSLSVPAAAVRVPLPRHRCHLKHTTGYHDSFSRHPCANVAPTYLQVAFEFPSTRADWSSFESRLAEMCNCSQNCLIFSLIEWNMLYRTKIWEHWKFLR